MSGDSEWKEILARILRDMQVEFSEEFDRNFQRQGFFGEAWKRRRSPSSGGAILVRSGSLRRSIISRKNADGLTFSSSLPYSEIHNEGGEIRVTRRMKGYFWHRYYQAVGGFGRKKDGSRRNDKRTIRLSDEAEFWKRMALMKVGDTITIPKRQFLGTHPKLEQAGTEIIEKALEEHFDEYNKNRNL